MEQARRRVNRSQPAVNRKPLISRHTGASAEKLAPQCAEPVTVDGGIAPFNAADASILQGDQAADIAVGSGSAVSAPEGVAVGTQGATSGRGGSSVDSARAPAGASVGGGSAPAESSRKSSTPSDIDSASGAVIPGYVIDAAGHRSPDAGAIFPEVDKYVLYGADKRTAINVLGTKVCIEGEFLRSKEAARFPKSKPTIPNAAIWISVMGQCQ